MRVLLERRGIAGIRYASDAIRETFGDVLAVIRRELADDAAQPLPFKLILIGFMGNNVLPAGSAKS